MGLATVYVYGDDIKNIAIFNGNRWRKTAMDQCWQNKKLAKRIQTIKIMRKIGN